VIALWLIKIGGSLIDDHPRAMPGLVRVLTRLNRQGSLLAVAGGGRSADLIRRLDCRHGIGDSASHWMAIASMELNSYRLAARYPEVFEPQDGMPPVIGKRIPLLLPTNFLTAHPLPERWDVTSDSIAAHLAHHLGAMLILLKTLDHIREPRHDTTGQFSVSAEQIDANDILPVDRYLLSYLERNRMNAILANGLHPERLESIVKGEPCRCTIITGRSVGNEASG
jgi:aspartokinase-like uncharacterized kinase